MEIIGGEMNRIKEVGIKIKIEAVQEKRKGVEWLEEDNKEIWERNNEKAEMFSSHSELSENNRVVPE
jgi:hypothetical protein